VISNGNAESGNSNNVNASNNGSNNNGNLTGNRKRDFQKRKSGDQEQYSNRDGSRGKYLNKSNNTSGASRENNFQKDSSYQKSSYANKDNGVRHGYNNSSSKGSGRVKSEETIEDIRTDIARIEKEIELELKEIRSLRLGV